MLRAEKNNCGAPSLLHNQNSTYFRQCWVRLCCAQKKQLRRLPLATTIRIKLTSDQASYDQAPRRKDNCGACSLLPRSELNSLPPRLGVTTLHEEFNQHFPIKPPDSGRVRGSIILPSATRPVMCPSVCPVLCPAMFSNEFCPFNAGNAIT